MKKVLLSSQPPTICPEKGKMLLHIGYSKAGSSFLQKWFKEHPQLRYAPRGLAGFDTVCGIIDVALDNPDSMPNIM